MKILRAKNFVAFIGVSAVVSVFYIGYMDYLHHRWTCESAQEHVTEVRMCLKSVRCHVGGPEAFHQYYRAKWHLEDSCQIRVAKRAR